MPKRNSVPVKTPLSKLYLVVMGLLVAGVVLFGFLYDAGGAVVLLNEQAEKDAQAERDRAAAEAEAAALASATSRTVISTTGRLLPYLENGLWGYKNTDGEIVILPQYSLAQEFEGDVAFAAQGGLYGLISRAGVWIVDPMWTDALSYSEGLAAVQYNEKWGFIDTSGATAIDYKYREVGNFSCGRAVVRTTSSYGYIDIMGNMVISEKWKTAYAFCEDLAFAYSASKDSGYIINKLGEPLITLDSGARGTVFSQGFALIHDDGNYYFINSYAKRAYKTTYADALPFSEGLAAVKVDGLWGYIGTGGVLTIPAQYSDAQSFCGGYAAVMDAQGLWGYIDTAGTTTIDFQYSEAQPFSQDCAVVQKDGSYFALDTSGSETLLYRAG